jgi:hypothetical protein
MKILYLYDYEYGAIHNVGKLWFGMLDTEIEATFMSFNCANLEKMQGNYDYIFFGYLDLYMDSLGSVPREKAIVAIHDPCELFPMVRYWKKLYKLLYYYKRARPRVAALRHVPYLVTISREMSSILQSFGLLPYRISTCSALPVRDSVPETVKADGVAVYRVHRRKNPQWMHQIRNELAVDRLKLQLRGNAPILSESEYARLLDQFEIYVCTSYQEGGPIPTMDAMHRGCVVLTTPVGQMPEIIQHGENGFLCHSPKQFIESFRLLSENLELLHKMRLNSVEAIARTRSRALIKKQVKEFFDILGNGSSHS